MLAIYRKLLDLYPLAYRQQFADEMVNVFLEVHAENQETTLIQRCSFCAREITGLVGGALREHLRSLGAQHGFSLDTRRFAMRNGFRFPKSTAILMMIILAGVVIAIRQGEAIATSLPPFSQPITPIHTPHSYLLPGVIEGFIFFYAAGLIGWAIVFALRRSGVHRLDDMGQRKS